MKEVQVSNRNRIWIAVLAPIFLCSFVIVTATSLGSAYYYTQAQIIESTASAVYALNAQKRLTQTAVQTLAQQERATQTAAAAQKTLSFAATATSLAQSAPTDPPPTPTPASTSTPVVGGNFGFATVTFKECRGKEGSVQFGAKPPQSLHSFQSITYNDVPAGAYHLKVNFPNDEGYNFEGQVQIYIGTQVIPFGDQCR